MANEKARELLLYHTTMHCNGAFNKNFSAQIGMGTATVEGTGHNLPVLVRPAEFAFEHRPPGDRRGDLG